MNTKTLKLLYWLSPLMGIIAQLGFYYIFFLISLNKDPDMAKGLFMAGILYVIGILFTSAIVYAALYVYDRWITPRKILPFVPLALIPTFVIWQASVDVDYFNMEFILQMTVWLSSYFIPIYLFGYLYTKNKLKV